MITMLFTVGSLEDAINAASPFQNSFTNTGSTGVNVALTLILALLIAAANITSLATTSREVWAFARDGGPPGHRWISKVGSSPVLAALLIQSPSPGPPRPKRPLQRRPHHLRPLLHPLPDPTRQHRCLQHRHLPQPHRLPKHLPCLHRLPPSQALPARTITARALQPRSMGPAGQFVRLLLLAAHSRLQLLPRQRAGRREYGELGPGDLGRRAGYCVDLVRPTGEEGLQRPSDIHRGGQEGRNGVADGLRGRSRSTCLWRQSGHQRRLKWICCSKHDELPKASARTGQP